MRIVIDVPDKVYEMVMNTGTYGCYRFNSTAAIRKGVPLDKIRAEIEQRPYGIANDSVIHGIKYERMVVLEIIDKYTAESEEQ